MSETPVMPIFVFARRRDIELEGGYILAGNLVIGDLPKQAKPNQEKQAQGRRAHTASDKARPSGTRPGRDDVWMARRAEQVRPRRYQR